MEVTVAEEALVINMYRPYPRSLRHSEIRSDLQLKCAHEWDAWPRCLLLPLVMASSLACTSLDSRESDSVVTQPEVNALAPNSSPHGGARLQAFQDDEQEVILIGDHTHHVEGATIQVDNADGESDYPVFRLCAFEDGCFFYQSHGLGTTGFTMGHVNERVIARLLLDADSFDFFQFDESLHLPDPLIPDLQLTIRNGANAHTVIYSQIVGVDKAGQVEGLGLRRATQIIVSCLLGARVLDLAQEFR